MRIVSNIYFLATRGTNILLTSYCFQTTIMNYQRLLLFYIFMLLLLLLLGVQISSDRFKNLNCLKRREIFSRWDSKIAWEMGKSRNQRWTILWLISSFILFWNKCIFDNKKRTELICTPNIFSSFRTGFIHSCDWIIQNIWIWN